MNVFVSGQYMTKFGEHFEKSLLDLSLEATFGALTSASLTKDTIDAIVVSNMLSDTLSGQGHLGALISGSLGLTVEAFRVEGACASGGIAVKKAVDMLKAGTHKNILVLGVEKMCDHSSSETTQALTNASDAEKEAFYGITFPGLYAMMARRYFYEYQIGQAELAAVSVKNHYHGARNKKAHFPKEISEKVAMTSSKIADPLRLFDCSPISDGAAALVLSSHEPQSQRKPVRIVGSSIATDSVSLQERKSLTSIKAAELAGKRAYIEAGISSNDVDVAEVHDCFTIAEILALEDLGFFKRGTAGYATMQKKTYYDQEMPINTSGGLKSCGHPVGATGVKQVVEITEQLQGTAEGRQVDNPQYGLTHNVGGSGATCAVHILTNTL
ncbi:thiolase domain-containing protein [Patescibacteria group bacterium]|nr:thiolase domain-containing protein [Patescibacteria group bacterium]